VAVKGGVRLSGGEYRGRTLAVPPGARPTEGRVREALFGIWSHQLDGARVLDLFAASGAVGLEALGRGALSLVSVDADPRAVRLLRANAEMLGLVKGVKGVEGGGTSAATGPVDIRRLSLPDGLPRLADAAPFDLVFADPPYRFDAHAELLAGIAPLLAAESEVAVEHAARTDLPPEVGRLVRADVRRYGESALSFYRPLSFPGP
jgi:16S rRNA (guanine966-N2)-methyltransferase